MNFCPAIFYLQCSTKYIIKFNQNWVSYFFISIQLKTDYLEKIQNTIRGHHIPPSLVINFDQTGLHMVPSGQYTYEEKGAKQVNTIEIIFKSHTVTNGKF